EERLKRERVNKQEEGKKRGVTDEKDEQKRHNQSEEDSKQHAKQELMEKRQHPYIRKRSDGTRQKRFNDVIIIDCKRFITCRIINCHISIISTTTANETNKRKRVSTNSPTIYC